MSRSFKKSPVVSPSSSKQFNAKANRRLRQKVRLLLLHKANKEDLVLPLPREITDIYKSPKDGRCNMFGMTDSACDEAELKKLMRK